MTPLLTALSRAREASRRSVAAASASPLAAFSLNLRTAVFSDDLTALLRTRRFSFCLLRLIWDLMFATRGPRPMSRVFRLGRRQHSVSRARRVSLPAPTRGAQIDRFGV